MATDSEAETLGGGFDFQVQVPVPGVSTAAAARMEAAAPGASFSCIMMEPSGCQRPLARARTPAVAIQVPGQLPAASGSDWQTLTSAASGASGKVASDSVFKSLSWLPGLAPL
jgi:hypothetical protein